MIDRDDEVLGRLLTEHLPPIPPELAAGPRAALPSVVRARTRRRVLAVVPVAAALVAAVIGASTILGRAAAPRPLATGAPVSTSPYAGLAHTLGPAPAPGSTPQAGTIGVADLSADGRTLYIPYDYGSCDPATLGYGEDAAQVSLRLVHWLEAGACTLELRIGTFTLRLSAPLGSRRVVDAGRDHAPIPLRHLAELRTPHYLPPGCALTRKIPGDPWDSTAVGGGYRVGLHQGLQAEQQPPTGEQVQPVRTVTVHGQRAQVLLRSTPPKLDPRTGKPYLDPATGRPYEERRITIEWLEDGWRFAVSVQPDQQAYHQADLVTQALRVADGLR